MKVCGQWIKNMDRAPIGDKKIQNSEENTQVIGSKTRSMVEEPFSLKMVIDTMVIGSMVCLKVKAV